MNNHELANKIMECGVGSPLSLDMVFFPDDNHWMGVDKFVRDWRVVGEMIAKCVGKPDYTTVIIDKKVSSETMHRCWIERTHSGSEVETYHARNESLPRAINETAVQVLL